MRFSSAYVDPSNLLGAKFYGTDGITVSSGNNRNVFVIIEMEVLEALYPGESTKEKASEFD